MVDLPALSPHFKVQSVQLGFLAVIFFRSTGKIGALSKGLESPQKSSAYSTLAYTVSIFNFVLRSLKI